MIRFDEFICCTVRSDLKKIYKITFVAQSKFFNIRNNEKSSVIVYSINLVD
jgi:hypothetical protein